MITSEKWFAFFCGLTAILVVLWMVWYYQQKADEGKKYYRGFYQVCVP